MNNVVSQSVAHLHLHVVPRTKGDGLRGFFWPRTRYAEGEAAAFAGLLRASLSGKVDRLGSSGLLDTVNDAAELSESAAIQSPAQW